MLLLQSSFLKVFRRKFSQKVALSKLIAMNTYRSSDTQIALVVVYTTFLFKRVDYPLPLKIRRWLSTEAVSNALHFHMDFSLFQPIHVLNNSHFTKDFQNFLGLFRRICFQKDCQLLQWSHGEPRKLFVDFFGCSSCCGQGFPEGFLLSQLLSVSFQDTHSGRGLSALVEDPVCQWAVASIYFVVSVRFRQAFFFPFLRGRWWLQFQQQAVRLSRSKLIWATVPSRGMEE